MNADTLPLAVLILVAEFAAGCLLVLAFLELRDMVPVGYLRTSSGTILVAAILAVVLALTVLSGPEVGGYPLAGSWILPARVALILILAASVAHNVAGLVRRNDLRRVTAVTGGVMGVLALASLAAVFQPPTWGFAGAFSSFLIGSLSLGTTTLGMLLGHWYLVNPRLSEQPLNELVLGMIGVLVVHFAVVVLNAVVPPREALLQVSGFDLGLEANPAFWLRVGIGLVFPVILGVMAWQSSRLRGMMSATGLLYIAMGAVLAGQALARGLLFATGAAV